MSLMLSYFDNEGIDAAAKYLRDADVIDWLAEKSSGVVLISFRAFARETSAKSVAFAAALRSSKRTRRKL